MLKPNFMVRSAVMIAFAGLMVRVTGAATGTSRELRSWSPAALVTWQTRVTRGPAPATKVTRGASVPAVISPPVTVQA